MRKFPLKSRVKNILFLQKRRDFGHAVFVSAVFSAHLSGWNVPLLLLPFSRKHDIMSLKEKQAAAEQTFVFLGSLANEYPAKQDLECDSTNS